MSQRLSLRHARSVTIAAVGCALLIGATGCSGDDREQSSVDAVRLAAKSTMSTNWAADYALTASGQQAGTLIVAHSPTSLRLDITTPSGTATSISGPTGVVSCQTSANKQAKCLQVAGPGQTPPGALDPALRPVFANTLAALAAGNGQLTETDDLPAQNGFPAARCVNATGSGVTPGTYCLFDSGVLAKATFEGAAISITKIADAPDAKRFVPPAVPSTPAA